MFNLSQLKAIPLYWHSTSFWLFPSYLEFIRRRAKWIRNYNERIWYT